MSDPLINENDHNPDESDERMFTDSFAPQDAKEPDDELDEIEKLLPQAEPTDGAGQLP